ncbi:MAG: hypothetical protein NWE95_06190 [Candidatus Bathyarchaeota archaeon]|nr:hypothetical protein [Candidatus Bathyarchaeota archaeon]
MREHHKIVCLVIGMLLLLFLFPKAGAQNYFEYHIQVNNDGSAVWTITQFSNVDSPVDTWQGFQEKIFTLVDAASNLTERGMEISEESLQINTTISSASKITEYSFIWQNFSIVNDSELRFGDVFQVENFFGQLYGDAALELSYPSDFRVKSVSPPPNERQDSTQTLRWARTHDLASGVSVILTRAPSNGFSDNISQYGLIVVALAVGVTVSLLGFFAVKRRRNKGENASTTVMDASPIESEEDKILKVLKSSGGSMRQSEITERCRFSKAKTSQLLSALENSGVITRYKKGRDKIVTLKERVKGESS